MPLSVQAKCRSRSYRSAAPIRHAERVGSPGSWTVVLDELGDGDPAERVAAWRREFDPEHKYPDDDIRVDLICGLSDGLDYVRVSVRDIDE